MRLRETPTDESCGREVGYEISRTWTGRFLVKKEVSHSEGTLVLLHSESEVKIYYKVHPGTFRDSLRDLGEGPRYIHG